MHQLTSLCTKRSIYAKTNQFMQKKLQFMHKLSSLCTFSLCKSSKAVCSRYISGPLVYHFHQPITLICFIMLPLIISGPINSCFMGNNFVGRCIDKRCCNRVDSTMVSEQVAAIFWPLLATAAHMHKAIICTLPCCNNVLSISDMDS